MFTPIRRKMQSEEEVKKIKKELRSFFRHVVIKYPTLRLLRKGKRNTVKCLNQSLQSPIA